MEHSTVAFVFKKKGVDVPQKNHREQKMIDFWDT